MLLIFIVSLNEVINILQHRDKYLWLQQLVLVVNVQVMKHRIKMIFKKCVRCSVIACTIFVFGVFFGGFLLCIIQLLTIRHHISFTFYELVLDKTIQHRCLRLINLNLKKLWINNETIYNFLRLFYIVYVDFGVLIQMRLLHHLLLSHIKHLDLGI